MQMTTTLGVALVLCMLIIAGTSFWVNHRNNQRIERGLYGEIIALRWQAAAAAAEIARRYEANEPFDDGFFSFWPLSTPMTYLCTSASELGYLSRDARAQVSFFHGQLADARSRWVAAQNLGKFKPSPYRIVSSLLRAYYEIDPWVKRLKPKLGAIPEEAPDLTQANELLSKMEAAMVEPVAVAYCGVDCAHPKNS